MNNIVKARKNNNFNFSNNQNNSKRENKREKRSYNRKNDNKNKKIQVAKLDKYYENKKNLNLNFSDY